MKITICFIVFYMTGLVLGFACGIKFMNDRAKRLKKPILTIFVVSGIWLLSGCQIQSRVCISVDPNGVLKYERYGDIAVNDVTITKEGDTWEVNFTQSVSEDKALVKSLEVVQDLSNKLIELPK